MVEPVRRPRIDDQEKKHSTNSLGKSLRHYSEGTADSLVIN